MAFTPKDWRDLPDATTPLSASAMEDMETRLSGYTDARETAARGYTDTRETAIRADHTTVTNALDTRLDALETPSVLSLFKGTQQTVTDGTSADITWTNPPRLERGVWWSNSTPSIITFPASGLYRVRTLVSVGTAGGFGGPDPNMYVTAQWVNAGSTNYSDLIGISPGAPYTPKLLAAIENFGWDDFIRVTVGKQMKLTVVNAFGDATSAFVGANGMSCHIELIGTY